MAVVPRIRDFDDPSFDPFVADEIVFGTIADPHTLLAEMRRRAPVHQANFLQLIGLSSTMGQPGVHEYMVLSYEHVCQVLHDMDTFSNEAYGPNLAVIFGHTISAMDPPEHSAYRPIFQRAFLPGMIEKWGETIVDPAIDMLMDRFVARGEADLVQEFTQHYPFEIIYRQLALPPGDAPIFHRLAIGQNLMVSDWDHAVEASNKLGEYFTALIAERKERIGDDLVSALLTAEVEGEKLPDEIVIAFLRQLINAAGDTTSRGTGTLLAGLLTNPDQLSAVYADRGLIPQAIEESLRWEPPVMWVLRHATRNVELGDMAIPKGSRVDVFVGAANRDETHFPDPERFDIFRERAGRHIAFAVGPHICLGQHLARLEMSRALNAILDRLPNLRLDPDKPAPVIQGSTLRYPKHLFVRFG